MKKFFIVFPEIMLYMQPTWESPIYDKEIVWNQDKGKAYFTLFKTKKQSNKITPSFFIPDW